jgi:hypothetical protein
MLRLRGRGGRRGYDTARCPHLPQSCAAVALTGGAPDEFHR